MTHRVVVQESRFDIGEEMARLEAISKEVGAVASFVGTVRDTNEGRGVGGMFLEHYPGMTEKSIAAILAEAEQRWAIIGATVIHRVGNLLPGEQIVLVMVASRHRGDAFAACEFVMDYLKTRAPFWKREATSEGARWVDARTSDDEAAQRWSE